MSNTRQLHHLESRIAAQKQDLQTLLVDNQRLAASHVALKQELASSVANIRILTDAASKTRDERDAEIRGLIEQVKRREEDARRVEELKKEVNKARMEVWELEKDKIEMEGKADKLKNELERMNGEIGKLDEVKKEIEYMRHEVERGKAAIEYEKKIYEDNLLHRQRMEESMVSMASEVDQLRSELVYAEKRARAVAAATNPAPRYPELYGSSGGTYGGSTYTTAYGSSYQISKLETEASPDVHHNATPDAPTISYNMQPTHAYR